MSAPLALTLGEPAGIGPDITLAAWHRRGEFGLPPFNPVAEAVLYQAGFPAPGHTEYLAQLAQQATGKPTPTAMMLWSPQLAVVPVTIHLPLREVPGRLTVELIVDTARIVARDLEIRFGMARPRL